MTKLVYFYSPSCVACKLMTPTLKVLDEDENVALVRENVEEDSEWAEGEQVEALPTLIAYDSEMNELTRWVGLVSQQDVREFLESVQV